MNRASVSEIARSIAHALADDRVRRHQLDLPVATDEEERLLARQTAEQLFDTSNGNWGMSAPLEIDERSAIDEAISRVLGLGKLE